MSFTIPDDLKSLSDRELSDLLKEATAEERRVSDRRNNLQDRLDFLRAGGGSTTSASSSLFEKLVADEERVSEERRQMHRTIDRLNAERMRRFP